MWTQSLHSKSLCGGGGSVTNKEADVDRVGTWVQFTPAGPQLIQNMGPICFWVTALTPDSIILCKLEALSSCSIFLRNKTFSETDIKKVFATAVELVHQPRAEIQSPLFYPQLSAVSTMPLSGNKLYYPSWYIIFLDCWNMERKKITQFSIGKEIVYWCWETYTVCSRYAVHSSSRNIYSSFQIDSLLI